jgi:hypothetical protein
MVTKRAITNKIDAGLAGLQIEGVTPPVLLNWIFRNDELFVHHVFDEIKSSLSSTVVFIVGIVVAMA